jgi:hypothetical protein
VTELPIIACTLHVRLEPFKFLRIAGYAVALEARIEKKYRDKYRIHM